MSSAQPAFAELEHLLSLDWGEGGLWDEVGLERAAACLAKLTEVERRTLFGSWRARTTGWQERLAGLLALAGREEALPLLAELLTAADVQVMLGAADSVRSFGGGPIGIEPVVLDRLRHVASRAESPIDRMRAKEFLRLIT